MEGVRTGERWRGAIHVRNPRLRSLLAGDFGTLRLERADEGARDVDIAILDDAGMVPEFASRTRVLLLDSGDAHVGEQVVCIAVGAPVQAVRRALSELYRRRGHSPESVAKAIVGAAESGKALVPVSSEAWLLYVLKRLAPSALPWLLRASERLYQK